ncbi:Actin-related protein [Pseudozyma hubeiensis]|nr:Actin-related protein [Pseudozyma hubeiensis]
MHCNPEFDQHRQSIIATRAPSLSLLIHTQPDPWTRRIDLDLPTTHPTDFGPNHPVTQAESIEYGPKLAHTILGHTMTSRQTTTATSFGYGSAVASSTNPYHVQSSDVVASRDASAAARSVDAAGSMGEVWVRNGCLRVDSPWGDDVSRSATHDLLLERKARDSDRGVETRSFEGMWCAGGLALLWIPIALSTAALVASKGQMYILLASFCVPAWMHLVHLFLARRVNLHRRQTPSEPRPPHQPADTSTPPSASSTTSSPVPVNPTPRSRRPHHRSYSFPLEFQLKGYHTPYLGNSSRARSVPYLSQHWTAGKISGDRVVAPRNSFVRGLSLMFHPRPKLEVLPARGGSSKAGDGGGWRREGVMSMLEVPGGEACAGTMDSERTCFVEATTSSVVIQQSGVHGQLVESSAGTTEVVLDMDETPGSPRVPLQPLREHAELESPTKRQPVQDLSNRSESRSARSPGFSDDPSITGNSSTSRLFSEILQLVRGPVQSNPSHPNSNQTSSAHHYNLINSSQLSLYVAANESNSLPQQPEVSPSTSLSRAPSSSSTVSLSSISSRIRTSLRRQPSTSSTSSPRIKKIRSRTFASAFGIELNLLKRGSVEGSPSTISEGTVGSLMDSPSRIPYGYSQGEMGSEGKLHRRQTLRADSIVDLREEVEDTLEEVMSSGASCDSQLDGDAEAGEVEGVDLADMTFNDDVWDRHALDTDDQIDSSIVGAEDDLMGFESRRMVARPPFLDTVAEEPEDVEVNERGECFREGEGVAKLLREHEMMFPHKTLSRIEEVTEVMTRSSRMRLDSSGSGGSRRAEKMNEDEETEVRLGLPLSLGCEMDEKDAKDQFGLAEEIEDDDVEADECGKGGSERILPFVTPRSTIRRRAAAARLAPPTPTRKFFTTSPTSSKATPLISPSPRSKITRLSQLGLDQGFWSSSPPHLPLHNTLDHSFELVSPPTRTKFHHSISPRRNLLKHSTTSPPAKKALPKASSSKKRRKSRLKGVAVMIARHRFTVVDEDDSLVQQ